MLACGCSDGIVRVFRTDTLEHIVTLPKPPPLGSANIKAGVQKIKIPAKKDSKFTDAISILIDSPKKKIVVQYSDQMVFIWDIKNF